VVAVLMMVTMITGRSCCRSTACRSTQCATVDSAAGPDVYLNHAAGWVEPLLAKYGVQAYLAGHDHDLEHIHVAGQLTHHIVSGAGSQIRPEFAGAQDSRFQAGAQGEGLITQQPCGMQHGRAKPAALQCKGRY
jgi:hypothetical protein